MKSDEHILMVHMFARQMMLFQSLLEILKSRGVLQRGDIEAFEALVREEEQEHLEIFHAVVNQYQAFARELGIQEGLPSV